MPAYDESKRKKLFGVYTGCPCSLTLDVSVCTKNKNLPDKVFKGTVENLIKEWHESCEKYFPGPRVAPRITQNWDKNVKLPYGKYADIRCIYDESSVTGSYCKHSIKELKIPLDQNMKICQATGKLHRWVKTKDFSDLSTKNRCKDCSIDKEDTE